LNVEGVSEEEVYILHPVFKADVLQGLITQFKNALLHLLVSEFVFFVFTFKATGLIRFFFLSFTRLCNGLLEFLIARQKLDHLQQAEGARHILIDNLLTSDLVEVKAFEIHVLAHFV
jgi:hypothetical protein